MINTEDLNLKLFEDANKQFGNHLLAENNNRIIFSGKFGHGKTTFLKWFFEQEEQKEKYNVIRLFPVNYSVASNEDIFEYIKYDILLEMLEAGYTVKSLDPSKWKLAPFYIKDNKLKIASFLAKRLPIVGKSINSFIDELATLKEDFDEYCDKVNLQQDETEAVKSFLSELENEKGSLYEKDAITELIKLMLERGIDEKDKDIEKEKKKETVLIIDDLDRIDPEHIFRILNVFAAHFDLRSNENKFGFDKVMVVCDIENIRNIFKAKYGVDTDFNGYIDKFYTHNVFLYDIKRLVLDYAVLLLRSAVWMTLSGEYLSESWIDMNKSRLYNEEFLGSLLMILVSNNEINLRNIVKWKEQKIVYLGNIFTKYDRKKGGFIIHSNKYFIPFCIIILSYIKGGIDSLRESVLRINQIDLLGDEMNEICAMIAYIFVHSEKHVFIDSNDNKRLFNFTLRGQELKLVYINRVDIPPKMEIQNIYSNKEKLNVDDFKELFIRAIDLISFSNQL